MLTTWRRQVRRLKRETYALALACRDRRTPWYAKAFAAAVVAYAFSPIDLIPDFIPVLGVLDDLILVPLGIIVALRMIPPDVMAESRARADALMAEGKPVNRIAAAVIIALWLAAATLAGAAVWRMWWG
ncbi:MAG: DUF1232 domain-containing protein [Chloroflexi bacterium]|nr:DUF1232 domain-containing protein [Chloroflexota bacterium]